MRDAAPPLRRAVDVVVGIEARGFILAAPVAIALGVGFVPVRKRGKLPGKTMAAAYELEYGTATIEVHADAFVAGQRVLVVDDVLATGGTAAATCLLVERGGAKVVAVEVLMELGFLGRPGRSRLDGRDGARRGHGLTTRTAYDSAAIEPRPSPTDELSHALAGLRARFARLGAAPGSAGGNPVLEPLLRTVRQNHPKADRRVIERAFDVAARAHAGQKRKSGDPYITHPVAVAAILAELGMTPPTLAAALLHDTVEDTDYTLEELRKDFGDEVAMLVDGVTKLDKVTYGDAAQAETVRKMVVAMSRDIRVLVIKLADRLHNARTWRYVSQESAERKARETLEIYAPLAHRLGMNTIKWELEDLSFATLYPKVYDEIVRLVAERAPAREDYLARSCASRSPPTCAPPRSRPRSPAGPSTTTPSTRR